jgi:hypothetical protein
LNGGKLCFKVRIGKMYPTDFDESTYQRNATIYGQITSLSNDKPTAYSTYRRVLKQYFQAIWEELWAQ